MEFINAYRRNIKRQNEEVIDTNPFAKAISILYKVTWMRGFQYQKLSSSGTKNYKLGVSQQVVFIEELRGPAIRGGGRY